ncbi:MAG: lytic transglycosylase domain-containing protein [Candidatus Doudnabacteria bacterium]|nr:lytic transglycosylase domain-containing protein [Candidatus Doudnabacteria bacterium]
MQRLLWLLALVRPRLEGLVSHIGHGVKWLWEFDGVRAAVLPLLMFFVGWYDVVWFSVMGLIVLLLIEWPIRNRPNWFYHDRIRFIARLVSSVLTFWVRRVTESALALYRLAKKLFARIQELPIKQRVAAWCGVGIACLGIGLWMWSTRPIEPVFESRAAYPIGASRFGLTDEELALRKVKKTESMTFWILKDPRAEAGAQKILGLMPTVEAAAIEYEVPAWRLAAHLVLESFGESTAQSPTGPVGIAQFTKKTAAAIGQVKDGKYLYRVRNGVIEDNRQNDELAIYGAAKLLRMEFEFFGDWDFTSFAYHSGRGVVTGWVKMYISPSPVGKGGKADLQKYLVSYERLYFDNSPYHNTGSYAIYKKLMLPKKLGGTGDFGPNYAFKVARWMELLQLCQRDHKAFDSLAALQRFENEKGVMVARNHRMWSYFRDTDKVYKDRGDLEDAIEAGEIVQVPNDPKFGFQLRLDGNGSLGEADPENRELYIATKPETAGCLLYVMSELRRFRQVAGERGAKVAELPVFEVTSLTRTIEYQKRLHGINPVATKAISFHVLGAAFDITRKGLSEADQRDLEFILNELDSLGFIGWVPENAAYHVVVAPEKEPIEFFRGVYGQSSEYKSSARVLTGW